MEDGKGKMEDMFTIPIITHEVALAVVVESPDPLLSAARACNG
ncbi:hypothetical protein [uncultured Mucilaginibacter sp.]|nr:hypothetical protein [uncultured Mucilaginibacter sp.]